MSNDKLKDALIKQQSNEADVKKPQTEDMELTDADLDDVAGGLSCGAMCGTMHLAEE